MALHRTYAEGGIFVQTPVITCCVAPYASDRRVCPPFVSGVSLKAGPCLMLRFIPALVLPEREENCFGGGGEGTEIHLPNPPPLVAVPGGGCGPGLPYLPCGGGSNAVRGGGGGTPTDMAQNDPPRRADHFDYTYVGGNFLVKKAFPGQNLCSGAFGGNIRPYTKQRARHGSPFLEPPPPLIRRAPMPSPPQSNFRVAQLFIPASCISCYFILCMWFALVYAVVLLSHPHSTFPERGKHALVEDVCAPSDLDRAGGGGG